MKLKKHLSQKIRFIFVLMFVIFNSCNSNELRHEQSKGTDSKDAEILSESIYFNVSSIQDTILTIGEDIKLSIPSGTFREDSVIIEVKLVNSIYDILINKLSTVTTDGELLESNGMIFIGATNNGDKILNIENQITIEFGSDIKQGMAVYQGIDIDKKITWKKSEDTLKYYDLWDVDEKGDTSFIRMYKNNAINSSNIGWINLDKLVEESNGITNLSIHVNDNNAYCALIFNDFPCVVEGYPRNKTVNFEKIPSNKPVVLIQETVNDNHISYNMLEFNTSDVNIDFINRAKLMKHEDLSKWLKKKYGRLW